MKTRSGRDATPERLRSPTRIPISDKMKRQLKFDSPGRKTAADFDTESAEAVSSFKPAPSRIPRRSTSREPVVLKTPPLETPRIIETPRTLRMTETPLTPRITAPDINHRKLKPDYFACAKSFLINNKNLHVWILIILIVEIILCAIVINSVKYTEIDWSTYMQQVVCFLNGTRNYSLITGDTGPIVYPAGHLYIYSLFYLITDAGQNIRLAQYIFALLYVANAALILRIYEATRADVKPVVVAIMFFSAYRVHSIFVLRMFNDPIAMLFMHAAIYALIRRSYTLSSVLFSLAVSVKMNVVLFAPAWAAILLAQIGVAQSIIQGTVFVAVQIGLGMPFLLSHPFEYAQCAFNFGRVFLYKWTVNWRFVPEEIFLDRRFHAALLTLHIILLGLFAFKTWFRQMAGHGFWIALKKRGEVFLFPQEIIFALWTANFAGIVFSRSLHYQFYCWYFYSIPYLLAHTDLPWPTHLAVMVAIEIAWNTYPSQWWSSALLHLAHLVIVVTLFLRYRTRRVFKKSE